jgi:hypothetical protein
MSDTRGEKLDVMLRSRSIEPIDPDFVPRIIAKSKALQQIQKTPAFDARKHLQPFQERKIIDEKQPVQEIVVVNCNS